MMVGYQGPDMGEPVENEERRFLAEEEARLAALRAEKEAFAQVLALLTRPCSQPSVSVCPHVHTNCAMS